MIIKQGCVTVNNQDTLTALSIEIWTGPNLGHGCSGVALARPIVLQLIRSLLIVIVTLASNVIPNITKCSTRITPMSD